MHTLLKNQATENHCHPPPMKQPRREVKLEPYNRHPKHRQSPREELE